MEIERKFLVKTLPENLEQYPVHQIQQAYLSTDPVLRIRRWDDAYILTYKGSGLLAREEHEFPLTKAAYERLLAKADGTCITKARYCIPFNGYTIELDIFEPPFAPLVLAEVEFSGEEEAMAFQPPAWFGADVTQDPSYTNAAMSRRVCSEVYGADEQIRIGRYRHFKGNEYQVLQVAKHSETQEPMVVYQALYGERGIWVRPAAMWNETVTRDGKTFRRFTYIGEA